MNADIWEKAVPLNQGRYQFGDAALMREYNALINSKPGAFSGLGQIANMIADFSSRQVPIEHDMRSTPEERNRLSKLCNEINYDCIRRLQRRELIAIGFSIPRHPDDPPRVIPPEILALGRIKFDSNKAIGDGLEFHAVRILPAEVLNIAISESNRPGRPSKRELIHKVYVDCCDSGLIDFTKPQKAAIEVVRARIQTMYPAEYDAGKGFGPEVVRDCISGDFGIRAKNQKL